MTAPRASVVDRVFLAAWALLAGYVALLAYYYRYTGLLSTNPGVVAALTVATVLLLPVALWGGERAKATLLFLAACLLGVELSLQALAFFGKIPNLWMTEEYAPYSRVYTAGASARGNDYCNRYGWHAPPFRLEAGSRRVALIGDSFIHAADISKYDNMAGRLEALLRQGRPSTSWEVLPLGISGTGPAQYFEVLRYAKERFGIQEAVIFVTEGNDFMNSVPEQMPAWWGPEHYIYYREGADGAVSLDPRSEPARYRMLREFELNHRSLFWSLSRTLRSNFILERMLKQLVEIARRRRSPKSYKTSVDVKDDLTAMGLDPFIYTVPPPPEARKSIRIVNGILRLCLDYAKRNGVEVRLVTIPYFTPSFYKQEERPDWTSRFGAYDLLQPERIVTDFARETGTPILNLGGGMREKKLTPREMWPLFLDHGAGHFSEKGHAYVAQALYDHFFADPR